MFPADGSWTVSRAKSDVRTHHFRRSYLKANKVSKSEGTRKVNMHIISDSMLMLYIKIIEISPCLLKLQLAKVCTFFETQCVLPHLRSQRANNYECRHDELQILTGSWVVCIVVVTAWPSNVTKSAGNQPILFL